MKLDGRGEATDEQWIESLAHSELHKSTDQECLEQEVGISFLVVLCFHAY